MKPFQSMSSRLGPTSHLHRLCNLPITKLVTLAFLSFALALIASAQGPPLPDGASLVIDGLEGPRGLTFGPDGLLYVAEAGLGGDQRAPNGCPEVPAVGPYHGPPRASHASSPTASAPPSLIICPPRRPVFPRVTPSVQPMSRS
jgi:hypothetical protein